MKFGLKKLEEMDLLSGEKVKTRQVLLWALLNLVAAAWNAQMWYDERYFISAVAGWISLCCGVKGLFDWRHFRKCDRELALRLIRFRAYIDTLLKSKIGKF